MPRSSSDHSFIATKISGSRIDFLTPVSSIPGVGARRAEAFIEAGMETVGDILYHFPRRYIDRSTIVPLGNVSQFVNKECTVAGEITAVRLEPGRRRRLRIRVTDPTGDMEALWFAGVQYYSRSLRKGARMLLTGKVTFYGKYRMVHPMIETLGLRDRPAHPFMPRYGLTMQLREAGVQQRLFSKAVEWSLDNVHHFPQVVPELLERRHSFPSLQECLRKVHFPDSLDRLEEYKGRLRYEELYKLALTLLWNRRRFALPGRSMHPGDLDDRFRALLPFTLTPDQEKAAGVLHNDAASNRRMHRLLQGDVGSGKTIVAFIACFPALNSGFQVSWLAPTEVLADQTFALINDWCKKLGFEAALLKGGMTVAERACVLKRLESGEIRFAVGTHALFMPNVKFKELGMIVIDEQHKFGAEQRRNLQEKDPASDFLLMSATPIPQTLAKTLYGDLDIVSIEHPPEGRQPVSTHIVPETKRSDMEQFVLKEIIREKAQAYVIVPRIEHEDDADDNGDEVQPVSISDAESTFKRLAAGTFTSVPIGCLHGRMSTEEKEAVMAEFVEGRTKLLVSTTVIEVGIDVTAATIMIIENAERFGLAQLHQLRGRVGRGAKKSWCFLLPGAETDEEGIKRLNLFCKHHNGFTIAELDLKNRGPGDVVGYRQSGWDDLRMADILRDAGLFREIQEEIEEIAGGVRE